MITCKTVPLALLILFCGCTSESIRIKNISSFNFTHVTVAGEPVGDIPAGATSEYVDVKLPFTYAAIEMTVDSVPINGQTLNLGSNRFTHEIDLLDSEKGRLDLKVIREKSGQ